MFMKMIQKNFTLLNRGSLNKAKAIFIFNIDQYNRYQLLLVALFS